MLASAATKVSQQKYPDAIDKLEDISNTATALADAPKPKLEDATAINDAATAAILCVGALPCRDHHRMRDQSTRRPDWGTA